MFRRIRSWFQGPANVESADANIHPSLLPARQSIPVDQLCAQLSYGTAEQRRRAAYDLGNHPGEPAVSSLLSALNDQDLDVQIYAIQSLKKQRAAEAVEPVCQLLESNSIQSLLVSNICSFLAEVRDARAVPTLLTLLKSSEAFSRYDAAFALGEIGDPVVLPRLRELITDRAMPHSDEDDVGTLWSVGENAQIAIDKIKAKVG